MGLRSLASADAPTKALIVIVDDDPIICAIASETLEGAGYSVVIVDDGADAMDVIWTKQPNLVILDCGLPGRPGMALLSDLRASAMFGDLPILMLTGRRSEWHEKIARKVGASTYIRKPFDPRELLVAVSASLSRDRHTSDVA